MRILFDHNIPSGTRRALADHEITEAIERGWERISNGELITNAEQAGFDVLLTADKRIRYLKREAHCPYRYYQPHMARFAKVS
jgi:hypothetical protein